MTLHPKNLSELPTAKLLEHAIGRDAHLALIAADELRSRGENETKLAFGPNWKVWPKPATTENFLRDAFREFGEEFANHLDWILEEGSEAAVEVAALSFPPCPFASGCGERLFAWAAGRRRNRHVTTWREFISPLLAVGSAGLTIYARDIVERADDKRKDLSARTLVRLFAQAASVSDAGDLLSVLSTLIGRAHEEHWPNPQLILANTLPAWPFTSAAIDVLVEHGLAIKQPEEIRSFSSDALISAGSTRVVGELIQKARAGIAVEDYVLRTVAYLGGPEAASFVAQRTQEPLLRALIARWLIEKDMKDSFTKPLMENAQTRYLMVRALGISGKDSEWIENVLTSTKFIDRGYAGLGLAYAQCRKASSAILRALNDVKGEGSEAIRERILLNAALIHSGVTEHSAELLELLPQHEALREDLAKYDIISALALANGLKHPAVRAWQRVACVRTLEARADVRLEPAAPAAAPSGLSTAVPVSASVQIGILTIKSEEFDAVLSAFPAGSVLVVGIAGGVPGGDLTLGDVVLSTRVLDFAIEARKQNSATEYAIGGGPVARSIQGAIANLEARRGDLGNWALELPSRPRVDTNNANFYGPPKWKKKVQSTLALITQRRPKFVAGVIGSSDRLIKDADLLISWLPTARNLIAVEMESSGVYRAARDKCAMVAIRGISDIVGFKRDEAWTLYACQAAASFAKAFVRTAPVPLKRPHARHAAL